jgi:hypothetical protein
MSIKLGNTKMKLGNRTPIISNPFNIVANMQLDISLENGQWLFSLNGLTSSALEALRGGREKIYIQLNRHSSVSCKRTHPQKIEKGSSPDGFFNISPFIGSKFQRMNLTDWVNEILYALSCARNMRGIAINQLGNDEEGTSTGLYYTDIGFTVVIGTFGKLSHINNLIGTALIPIESYIRINFYNTMLPINTNYTMSNNTINIYAQ